MKLLAGTPGSPPWLVPYAMQSIANWAFCLVVCAGASLLTPPPRPEQVTGELAIDWRKLGIFSGLGGAWYRNVIFWWGLFAAIIGGLMLLFSGLFL